MRYLNKIIFVLWVLFVVLVFYIIETLWLQSNLFPSSKTLQNAMPVSNSLVLHSNALTRPSQGKPLKKDDVPVLDLFSSKNPTYSPSIHPEEIRYYIKYYKVHVVVIK